MCSTGQVLHDGTVEATVGENVTLPCVVNSTDTFVTGIEWSKNRYNKEKLIVYHPQFGPHPFWPNVTLKVDSDTMSSNLHLYGVNTWDSGVYTCELATFPLGFVMHETELRIRGKRGKTHAKPQQHTSRSLHRIKHLGDALLQLSI